MAATKPKKRTPAATTAAQRALEAVRLRDEGMGFEEIGAILGISRQGATKAYDRGMELIAEETKDLARHRVAADARKLDRMERGLLSEAYSGNTHAVQAVLKVMERRAKLFGMDAPTKAELTGKDGEALGVTAASFAVPLSALPQDEWVKLAQSFAAAGEDQVNALLRDPDGSNGQ